jgi:hypothetical protein
MFRLPSRQFPSAALAGVAATAGMSRAARQAGVPAALAQAPAGALPFADASFGLITSTVS